MLSQVSERFSRQQLRKLVIWIVEVLTFTADWIDCVPTILLAILVLSQGSLLFKLKIQVCSLQGA